jgi:acyl-[acyl-carrier-protein]-phospholipid O-acyltransferase/long-chain-fatty-acid--[acyl-carrier-protein] ligase
MTRILKLALRGLLRLLYRVQVHGLEHYARTGPRCLIIANHTSLLDGVLLYAWLPETPTFAINTQIAERPLFRPFLGLVDLFRLDPTSPLSVKSMIRFIRQNRKAVIFPEGRITVTGIPMKVYEGPGLVADKADATILPVAIDGAQYSPFAYLKGRARVVWFPKIRMTLLPPEKIDLDPALHGHVRRKAAGREMQRLLHRMFFLTYDYRKTVLQALLDSARRHGIDRPILEDINREPQTYRQLFMRVFILARLIARETAPGEHVGVLLPNAVATPVVMLALQFAGRVPAMLNFTAGAQGILRACETGRIGLIYTSRKFIENARLEQTIEDLAPRVRIVCLEDLRARVSAVARLLGWMRARFPERHYRRAAAAAQPDSPAVLLFTSGSEGIPKGVVLSHANLLSNYAQVRCHIDFRPTDLLFSCLPLFHSFGLNGGLLMPLLGGSRTFLYPTPLHYRIIPELVYETGATILFGTSTFYKGYARHAHQYDFSTLRYAVAGAEKLRDEVQRDWMEKFGIRILQGYGVTEASPVIACNTPIAHRLGSVGQLMPGMDWYLEPVAGMTEGGRLIVRGPNIMQGYLLHGSTGIQPPRTDRGAGWYDTGDIAAVDADGYVSILGRAKRFAKIGGEMISLTAVEELALLTWPDYTHAALSLPDERKGERIVLVTDNPEAERREIQEQARTRGYSELYVPRRIVLAEELPLLVSGKTDYFRLQQLAAVEDRDGSGWIRSVSRLVGGTGSV